MGSADTSLKAWYSLQSQLGVAQKQLFDEIQRKPGTIKELARRLGWEAGTVSARMNELQERMPGDPPTKQKLGLALCAGKVKCSITGRTAYLWKAKQPLGPAMKPVAPKPQTLFT